ncbi:hypothetical protein C6366_16300 [Desulfonatronum sp. SC1]|nr:hypothetical protein C6366_16300 [Desulfonatronum sp. SC1]
MFNVRCSLFVVGGLRGCFGISATTSQPGKGNLEEQADPSAELQPVRARQQRTKNNEQKNTIKEVMPTK